MFHLNDTYSSCITDNEFNTPRFGYELYFSVTQFITSVLKFLFVNWDAIGNSCVSFYSSFCKSFVTSCGAADITYDTVVILWHQIDSSGLDMGQCHQRHSHLPV